MNIVLREGLNVGALSAEDDDKFLKKCFVDTISIESISDIKNAKSIVLGRTGAGKSALIIRLEDTQDNVIRINPESLSLNYISNSTILNYFEDLDINLDVFYQLLWRHVLVIELLKAKKQFSDDNTGKKLISNLYAMFNPNVKKKEALEYLFQFGESFWSDTEHRVREVIDSIASNLETETGLSANNSLISFAGTAKLNDNRSKQETTEIIHKAQKVVNGVQIQKLNTVMEFLSEDVFNDVQESYYIVIDDLDTEWVHDNLRFKLVRALIETIKKFRKIKNLKIVIGLRADLLETVIKNTSSKSFQTEKYEDMMLKVKWSKSDLQAIADKRINLIFKDQYTKSNISFYDIFAPKVAQQETFDYILDRSFLRPRDIISYINECLETATGNNKIGQNAIRNAERTYSAKRFRSIADEWREAYGDLEEPMHVLREVDVRFALIDITDEMLENLCINILAGDNISNSGAIRTECEIISSGGKSYDRLRQKFFEILYIVGVLGIKIRKGSPFEWSYKNDVLLNYGAITSETRFAIHPMLFRYLNKKADPTKIV